MASLFKDKRGFWYLQFYDRNKYPPRKKVALYTKKKTEANTWKKRREKEFIAGSYDPWGTLSFEHSLTLSEVVESYFKERPELRPKSREAYQGVAAGMRALLGVDMLVQHISITSLREYVYDDSISAATKKHRFGHLRTLFAWATKKKLLLENPFEDLSPPKRETRVPRILTYEEFTTFIAFVEKHIESQYASKRARNGQLRWLPVLIQLAVFTGLRRGELVSLDWNDIDFKEGYITVRNKAGFKTKSGSERAVPLISQARELLLHWRSEQTTTAIDAVFLGAGGKRLNAELASKRFREYRKMAELQDGFRFHDLRHTCASFLVATGVSDRKAAAILGHSDVRMMDIYAHLRPDSIKEAMQSAFPS